MNTKTITIQKDSQLISIYASGELTATQKKVYNYLIYMSKQMLNEDSTKHIFQVEMKDLIECITDNEIQYNQLKANIKELQKIIVEFNVLKKNKEVIWDSFPLLAGVKIKNGVIEYNFAFQVLEYIKKPQTYAYLDLRIMKNLDTKHSISLYEILQDYKNLKVVDVEINDFKKSMDIKDSEYPRFDNFKCRVIDPSVEEINSKTDLTTKYEKITKGRKVTGIKFFIDTKKEHKEKDKQITNRQSFVRWIRKEKVNVSMITTSDIFDNIQEIACSAKGLLYDKISGNTFDKEKSDRIWSKLYEFYQEQRLPWQKIK